MRYHSYLFSIAVSSAAIAIAPAAIAQKSDANDSQPMKMVISSEVKRDQLESLMAVARPPSTELRIRERELPRPIPYTGVPNAEVVDPVVQTSMAAPQLNAPATTIARNFDGLGVGFPGFTVNSAPPDTHGAVGTTQFVQVVNSGSFAVFDKATGNRLLGPVSISSLFTGFGGKCAATDDGDPVVNWDNGAKRWIITQFAITPQAAPFLECVAVSMTANATGGYFRYAFSYNNFPDYPKFAVWNNAYYFTFNLFNAAGTAFLGSLACAYDRSRMLVGAAATQQCFQTPNNVGSLLPSDADGKGDTPVNAPNYIVTLNATSLGFYRFRANFANPALTTFTGPVQIPVAAYNELCSGNGVCVPQLGTTNRLDGLSDRLMSRLSYRVYPDGRESLLVTHSVTSGLRFYEIRNLGAAVPTIFQQGSFAPTADTRWMGSIGQDKMGNIAIGYSASSSTTRPSVRFAVRAPGDPLGTLGNETTIINGTGSQTGGLTRWGDYSALTVDPVDDCTFWFTTEYLKANGSFNWSTRIASFKVDGCQ